MLLTTEPRCKELSVCDAVFLLFLECLCFIKDFPLENDCEAESESL